MSAVRISSDLMGVLAARRSQARFRIGVAVAMLAGFGSTVGWAFAFGWVAVYMGLQLAEHLLLHRRDLSTFSSLVLLSTNAIVFGAYGAMGPVMDGSWGLACGVVLMCGGLLNTALTSQKSLQAFVASAWPFAFYLGAMPFAALAVGAEGHHAVALAISAALIVGCTVMIWRSAARALIAEGEARARAEAADAAKSAFVAMVSHELRTPISAILAGAVEAGRAEAAGARASNLELIESSARMMRTLLDDLLDLSKIEAGKMGVEVTPFDLRRLMLETVRFWAPEARRRNLRFRVEGARRVPTWVEGDPTRVRQVLNNLFSNALKFTDSGSVTLKFAASPDGQATLSVIDTGPGMDAAQVGRLFTPYGQASDSVARTHGGTGLGLNISRELARLMGGDLSVESAPGQGAAFHLKVSLPAAAAVSAVDATQDRQGLRLLIVDDHEVNRRAFTLILQAACDELAVAHDGVEALERLATQRFDLVLMDLNMPRMGGMEAVRRLRAEPGPNQATPVIALTASVAPKEMAVCKAAGMSGFVMKPVEAKELFAAIEQVLSEARATVAQTA
ncbi:MAG: response regulator [Phenylobacterium sp.]|uniref:ATP-binding protein n=1 Tax=Phenylobacterium sp. TaxID=1871053 RepID=UPI0027351418|nr:ATP-binding protein [Phenylobacterium sp.]MDP3747451.1 response regulator [Phenylobacterium sp.]